MEQKYIQQAYSKVKVRKYFSLKDTINKSYSSCMVYIFTFPGYLDTQYIGETEQQQLVRIKEELHTQDTNE